MPGGVYSSPEKSNGWTDEQPHPQEEKSVLCVFGADSNSELCATQNLALFLLSLVGLLFLYQGLFIWKWCYKYSLCKERRVQLILLGFVYCAVSVVYYFSHGTLRVQLLLGLGLLHFWLCAGTVVHFFDRIMTILPEVQRRWNRLFAL